MIAVEFASKRPESEGERADISIRALSLIDDGGPPSAALPFAKAALLWEPSAQAASYVQMGSLSALTFRVRPSHIADDGLSTVVHMDMLDANVLLPAVTQASKDFHLHRKRLH